ncbi:tRNA-dependent cyclodipeptide synthase [Streptomyces sp. NHF165]|nr:tRNA-dependent cyclodipeptide synthase [Streptomyces sp. NHF165]
MVGDMCEGADVPGPTSGAHFSVSPITARCKDIWERGEHILVGVSTGNGYFNRVRLTRLLEWLQNHFSAVDVVYADMHIDTSLIALGCEESEARRRAKKRVSQVRRRVRQALSAVEDSPTEFRAHALSDFADSPVYKALGARVDRALAEEGGLSTACHDMVRSFLSGQPGGEGELTAEQIEAGLSYVRAEMPFLVDTPALLGVPSSVSCYHMEAQVWRALRRPGAGLRAAPGQAFAVVAPVDES